MASATSHWTSHSISAAYQRFRPTYPPELFAAIRSRVRGADLCVDIGCGTGQAVMGLSEHFTRVVGIDPSESQIAHATPAPNATYLVGGAESFSKHLSDTEHFHQADCVTVAQAIHWFDIAKFLKEAERVLKPDVTAGDTCVAFWTYPLCTITSHPLLDAELKSLDAMLMRDGYWPPERRSVDLNYSNLLEAHMSPNCGTGWVVDSKFPQPTIFPVVREPVTIDVLCEYMRTWSAVKNYRERNGEDPIVGFGKRAEALVGAAASLSITYDMIFFTAIRQTPSSSS